MNSYCLNFDIRTKNTRKPSIMMSSTLMFVWAFFSKTILFTCSFSKETFCTRRNDSSWLTQTFAFPSPSLSLSSFPRNDTDYVLSQINCEKNEENCVVNSVCWCSVEIPAEDLLIDHYNPETTRNATLQVPSPAFGGCLNWRPVQQI